MAVALAYELTYLNYMYGGCGIIRVEGADSVMEVEVEDRLQLTSEIVSSSIRNSRLPGESQQGTVSIHREAPVSLSRQTGNGRKAKAKARGIDYWQ